MSENALYNKEICKAETCLLQSQDEKLDLVRQICSVASEV